MVLMMLMMLARESGFDVESSRSVGEVYVLAGLVIVTGTESLSLTLNSGELS